MGKHSLGRRAAHETMPIRVVRPTPRLQAAVAGVLRVVSAAAVAGLHEDTYRLQFRRAAR